jgi:6-pyruvoyltetrahydropterin/6-carboxytetrahydropterin synthase
LTTLTRRYRFCASHRLHSESLSEAENDRIYGKCNNPYGHGHDYVLDVSVTGELNATTGLIVRLVDLDRLVRAEVLAAFSYRNLNQDVAEFGELVPTTENVALVIAGRLKKCWRDYFPYSSAQLSGISMQETERNSFEVVIATAAAPDPVVFCSMNESVIVNA